MKAAPAAAGIPSCQNVNVSTNLKTVAKEHKFNVTKNVSQNSVANIAKMQQGSDEETSVIQGRRLAALFTATHAVEVAVMITVAVICIQESFISGLSPFVRAGPHILTAVLPMVIISATSLTWTVHSQDFTGRGVAKFVCWFLHIMQCSVFWRFLKVFLAYDARDVAELATLRYLQTFFHTLPFIVTNTVVTLQTMDNPGIISLAVPLILATCAVVTMGTCVLAYHCTEKSIVCLSTSAQLCYESLRGQKQKSRKKFAQLILGFTTFCIFITRTLCISLLFCFHSICAIFFILTHWICAAVYFACQRNCSGEEIASTQRTIWQVLLPYLALWDYHVLSSNNTELKTRIAIPVSVIIYYIAIPLQNIIVVMIWYAADPPLQFSLRTAILLLVLLLQVTGLALLAISYMFLSVESTPITSCIKSNFLNSITSLVNSKEKISIDVPSVISKSLDDSKYIQDSVTVEQSHSHVPESNTKTIEVIIRTPPPAIVFSSGASNGVSHRIMSAKFPQSMFSYSNDLLPHGRNCLERSTTENGSFNSRNTHTLVTPTSRFYEQMQPIGSCFSDSFSSLSCGTVNHTSTPKTNASDQLQCTVSVDGCTNQAYGSCSSTFCHCKIFDVRSINGICEEAGDLGTNASKVDFSLRHDIGKTTPISNDTENLYTEKPPAVVVVQNAQRFHIVCSACKHTHDPLLTRCEADNEDVCKSLRVAEITHADLMPLHTRSFGGFECGSSSTDYPSDTEEHTVIGDAESTDGSFSTFNTWPVSKTIGMERLLQLQLGSHDYVNAWLSHQAADLKTEMEQISHTRRKMMTMQESAPSMDKKILAPIIHLQTPALDIKELSLHADPQIEAGSLVSNPECVSTSKESVPASKEQFSLPKCLISTINERIATHTHRRKARWKARSRKEKPGVVCNVETVL